MPRATSPRGEGTPEVPRAVPNPSGFEGWLAVGLCTVVLLASSAVLERSRAFSRTLLELERGQRPSGKVRAPRTAPAELVILLVLDGLRADQLGPSAEGSPRLSLLRDEGVAFQTVLAPASHALTAHKSLLTGRYPGTLMLEETGADLPELAALRAPASYMVDTFTRVRPLVPERFREAGFRTAGFTDGAWIAARTGFARGFELFDDAGGGLAAARTRALDWLERGRGQRAFLFLQTSELALGANPDTGAGLDPRADYDARLLRLDREVGRLLDGLRALGLYEPALIALTAGHGLSLGEGGRVGHGGLYPEELLVPLVLKFPQELDQRPALAGEAAELIDLAPTLLEAAGLGVPHGMDGRSLLPIVRDGARGRDCLVAESLFRAEEASPSARTFLRPGRWQVLHDPARGEACVLDLRADPTGLAAYPIAPEEVPELLEALLSRARPAARPRLLPASAPRGELERALEELGYGGGSRLSPAEQPP